VSLSSAISWSSDVTNHYFRIVKKSPEEDVAMPAEEQYLDPEAIDELEYENSEGLNTTV